MTALELKSPRDGSILTFRVVTQYAQEVEFEVSVRTPWFTGRAPASTFMNGSPSTMFKAMAQEWQGWKEPKSWQDLERRVSLSSLTDSTGHVSITVELIGQDYESRLCVVLEYEAGQLEEMALATAELLG
ncbi:hypothetical protein GCM10027046_20760 [Uliginosibacterium flavum]|uniref:DUF6228 family protein n=1 Tax=Uliginosibacterium flavum TaxID=1396831 RepID=A0ABV2TQQ2_9RHOO